SSDVCSSDLRGHQGGRLHQAGRDEVAERPAGSAGQAAHGWGSLGQVNVRRSLFLFLVGLLIASGCASTPQGVRGPPGRPLEGAVLRLASTIDRKSTRLNSSHVKISYAVFCLKKQTT